MARPSNAAVNGRGEIVGGSQFFQRVQLYEPNGRFLRGWRVSSHGGLFSVTFIDDDQLLVVPVRGDEAYIYDLEGNLQKNFAKGNALQPAPPAIDRAGNRYEIFWGDFYPTIVRQSPAGESTTVVSESPLAFIAYGPLVTWLCLLLAASAATDFRWLQQLRGDPQATDEQSRGPDAVARSS